MGAVTSTLTLKLVDGITGPAKKVQGSLKGIDQAARGAARGRPGGLIAGAGKGLAGLATAAAGYGAVRGVTRAVGEYAKADRALTRIRITAEASAAEIARTGLALRAMAQEAALPVDELVRGLDTLVQSGLSLQDAMAFLPSVAATAQATGSATEDIARTAAAMSNSLAVNAAQMATAFDALAMSGKLGQFEIRDMSEYLPRVAASAAKLGFVAADGVQRLGAMLQISRKVSGTAEQAATGVTDAFEKILSPTVLKAAQKHGLDFLRILEQAQKRGENGAEAIVQALMKATAGMNDVRRNAFLSSIFTESDSRRFIVAMIAHWDEYLDALKRVKQAHGVVSGDLSVATADAEAAIQRLSNSWESFLVSSGKLAYDSGAGGFLEDLTLAMRALSEGLAQAKDGIEGLVGDAPGDLWDKNVRQPAREKIERFEQERANPALRDERRARENAAKAGAEADRLEGIIEAMRGNPRFGRVQRSQTEADATTARAQQSATIDQQLAAGRRASAASSFADANGPSSAADMSTVPRTMGSVTAAMDISGPAAAAGNEAMGAFISGFQAQAAQALAAADAFAAAMKSKLSFTVSPVIAPSFSAPSGGGGAMVKREVNSADDRMYSNGQD